MTDSDEEFWAELPVTETAEPEVSSEINLALLSTVPNSAFPNLFYITRNGVYMDVTGIDNTLVRQLCVKFMVKTKAQFGNKWNIARGFNMIKQPPQTILLLPRFGFLEYYFSILLQDNSRQRKAEYAGMVLMKKFKICGLSNIVNQIVELSNNPNITSVGLTLVNHQVLIINYIMKYYFNAINVRYGFAGINLKLKTGAGKSYIAFGLINVLKKPTLLVVHNQPQAEDMYQLAKKYFPNTAVGIYHSTKKILGEIMIIVIHSACGADDYTFAKTKISVQEFYSKFSFVIFDESHKYCSPEFSKVYFRCQSTYMLGLSATPGERQDGFDPLTYWNVGPLVDIIEKIPNILTDDKFCTKILGIKYLGSPDYTVYKANDHGMFDNNATLIQMMEDPNRLELIVSTLEFLANNNRNVYIFSDRLEYLTIIRRKLFSKLKLLSTLDEEVIEFMKNQPSYEKYRKTLIESTNKRLVAEFEKVQVELNTCANETFYKENRILPLADSTWFKSALSSMVFKEYVAKLQITAQQHIERRHAYYSEIMREEGSQEYYNNLLETYKENYIDDEIEEKTSLSILTGGAKGDQINTSAEKATMIFTTYGYMGTGKSIPKMDTILFVTPRRNGIEQVVGRIFRPGVNKNTRWVIDLIDWKINLKSQWYERLNVYERQKEQNREPTIYEIETSFDNFAHAEHQKTLSTKFTDCLPDEFVFQFTKMNIPEPKVEKKRTRIIKKF